MKATNTVLILMLIATLLLTTINILISIHQIDAVKTTGYTSEREGTIDINILGTASITTIDSPTINFGQCNMLIRGEDYFTINSEGTQETPESCTEYERQNISVRNNGNVPVMIYISTDNVGAIHGGNFLNSTSSTSDLEFKMTNAGLLGNQGGCTSPDFEEYVSFEEPDTYYLLCDYLTPAQEGGQNSIITDFQITIPEDIDVGLTEVQITFLGVST